MGKELKLSLVAKRLSMLQDDVPNLSPLVMLPPEILVSCESSKPTRNTSADEVVTLTSSKNRKNYGSHKRAKVVKNDESPTKSTKLSACVQSKKRARLSPMKQAEAIQAKLGCKYPSFIKPMLKSHVSGGFWLGLPKNFCDDHLPNCDTTVVLVDEAGNESYSKYLAGKIGLSAGWRGFSIDHALLEGDVLIFHLISPNKFKVYIIREQNSGEVLRVEPIQETQTSVDKLPQSSSEGSEVLEGIQFSDTATNFEGLKSFENFNITVDGLVLDAKFSDSTRKKYYELCSNQKSFLHEHLLKGLNCSLVVGTISEVVNISDAINSCKARSVTSPEDLQIWERTLKGFEYLGMKVDFLRAHVNQLMGLASEHETEESNRLKEIIVKHTLAGERMKALEKKFAALKETMEEINLEVDDEITKVSAQKPEVKFAVPS